MDGPVVIEKGLAIVPWRDARLSVRVHWVVREGDERTELPLGSGSVEAVDDGGPTPRFVVRTRAARR